MLQAVYQVAPEIFERWGDPQGLGARSNGFGTHPRTWIREGGRKSRGWKSRLFEKWGVGMARAAPPPPGFPGSGAPVFIYI